MKRSNYTYISCKPCMQPIRPKHQANPPLTNLSKNQTQPNQPHTDMLFSIQLIQVRYQPIKVNSSHHEQQRQTMIAKHSPSLVKPKAKNNPYQVSPAKQGSEDSLTNPCSVCTSMTQHSSHTISLALPTEKQYQSQLISTLNSAQTMISQA